MAQILGGCAPSGTTSVPGLAPTGGWRLRKSERFTSASRQNASRAGRLQQSGGPRLVLGVWDGARPGDRGPCVRAGRAAAVLVPEALGPPLRACPLPAHV